MNANDPAQAMIDELLRGSGIELPDAEHGARCAAFANALFSGLAETLALEPERRMATVAAALFHDVGYLRSSRDHHRKALDVLRETNLPGIPEPERLIVACAARYHGGAYPNIEHAGFGEMTAEGQRVVRRIAAITRVAAALDASHLGAIDRVEAGSDAHGAWVVAYSRLEAPVEHDRLREVEGAFLMLTQIQLRATFSVQSEP